MKHAMIKSNLIYSTGVHNGQSNLMLLKPTAAFIGASWAALAIGMIGYAVGVWNAAGIELNEQGYYVVLLLMGLFSAISLQKAVRDKMEDLPVTSLYYSICWFVVAASLILLWVGLFNATFILSLKGFLGMSYVLSLFAVIAIQKNVRDEALFPSEDVASLFEQE